MACTSQLGSPQISPNKKPKKGKPSGTSFPCSITRPFTHSSPHRLPRLARQSRPRRLRPPLKCTPAPTHAPHPSPPADSPHPPTDVLPARRRAPQGALEAARLLHRVLPRALLVRLARLVARGRRHARVVLREPEPRAPARCERARRCCREGQAAGAGDGPAKAPDAAAPPARACAGLPHGCVARVVCVRCHG